jgi:hypothetical protein
MRCLVSAYEVIHESPRICSWEPVVPGRLVEHSFFNNDRNVPAVSGVYDRYARP